MNIGINIDSICSITGALGREDRAGIPAPMLWALYGWMHRFPETGRDNMGSRSLRSGPR